MDQQVNAAARAAGGDAQQALRRRLAEGRGKAGNHHETVLLRDGPGLRVVFVERRILVTKVHLDDLLDVLVQLRQPLFDLRRLRPDPPVDERLLIVAEVHQPGEVLPETDRIDQRENRTPRRMGGQHAQHHFVDGRRGGGGIALDPKRRAVGEPERKRDLEVRRGIQRETIALRHPAGQRRQRNMHAADRDHPL